MLRATTACTFSTLQLPKVVRSWCVLRILTWKCASRHNGVHFFDISTSKSGPRPPVFNTFAFDMCFAPQRRALFRHFFDISTSKSGPRPPVILALLTSKCASRHNSVHFFDISTSKSGPRMVCFVHFDLEMCFAPQRRALFRHRNFQKWSGPGVLCTISLCASRHNGVHFFDIATSKSGPKLRCFVHFDLEMCFAPQWRALFRHLNFQKWSETASF